MTIAEEARAGRQSGISANKETWYGNYRKLYNQIHYAVLSAIHQGKRDIYLDPDLEPGKRVGMPPQIADVPSKPQVVSAPKTEPKKAKPSA